MDLAIMFVIDHGYGYETLYGHMVRVKARNGQSIKRGEVIGWVRQHREINRTALPL
jgi:murein DD-endopeptidase MepM/ murein hydrolase activator NlpD